MTEQEINKAISKECGWIEIERDYSRDLNAMHEAVHHLRKYGNQFQWLEYTKNLFQICWGRTANSTDCVLDSTAWHVIEATASKRAEAFLRTIGKWKE